METMSSRSRILSRIHAVRPASLPHPGIPDFPRVSDGVAEFIKRLESFDGRALSFGSVAEVCEWLRTNIDLRAKKVFSSLPGFDGNFKLSPDDDLHRAIDIDVTVVPSTMGVAETGSVWLTDRTLKVPAAALLCTDLIVTLAEGSIIDGLQAAYSAIDMGGLAYGSFYTGPSATADIEAVRVTGAQGRITSG